MVLVPTCSDMFRHWPLNSGLDSNSHVRARFASSGSHDEANSVDWKEALKLIRANLAKLKLEDGTLAEVKIGEGDDAKTFDDLLGVLETGLATADTAADGTTADVLKLTKERDALTLERDELQAKVVAAGDVDARVTAAETKERTATERATLAETNLRSSRILGAARDKLDALKIPADQRKTAIALLNMDLEGVEVDDKGKVSGLDKRLGTLKKDHPHVFTPAKEGGGPAGDGGGDAGGTDGTGAGAGASDGSGGESTSDDARYAAQLETAMGVKPEAAAAA